MNISDVIAIVMLAKNKTTLLQACFLGGAAFLGAAGWQKIGGVWVGFIGAVLLILAISASIFFARKKERAIQEYWLQECLGAVGIVCVAFGGGYVVKFAFEAYCQLPEKADYLNAQLWLNASVMLIGITLASASPADVNKLPPSTNS